MNEFQKALFVLKAFDPASIARAPYSERAAMLETDDPSDWPEGTHGPVGTTSGGKAIHKAPWTPKQFASHHDDWAQQDHEEARLRHNNLARNIKDGAGAEYRYHTHMGEAHDHAANHKHLKFLGDLTGDPSIAEFSKEHDGKRDISLAAARKAHGDIEAADPTSERASMLEHGTGHPVPSGASGIHGFTSSGKPIWNAKYANAGEFLAAHQGWTSDDHRDAFAATTKDWDMPGSAANQYDHAFDMAKYGKDSVYGREAFRRLDKEVSARSRYKDVEDFAEHYADFTDGLHLRQAAAHRDLATEGGADSRQYHDRMGRAHTLAALMRRGRGTLEFGGFDPERTSMPEHKEAYRKLKDSLDSAAKYAKRHDTSGASERAAMLEHDPKGQPTPPAGVSPSERAAILEHDPKGFRVPPGATTFHGLTESGKPIMNAPYNVRTFRAQHKGWTADDHQSAADRLKDTFQRTADTPGAGIPMTVGALSSAHNRAAGSGDLSSGLKELRSHHAKIAGSSKPATLDLASPATKQIDEHSLARDLRASGVAVDEPRGLGKGFTVARVMLRK